jgi:hypothetical protein
VGRGRDGVEGGGGAGSGLASKVELEFESFRGFVVGDYRGVAGVGGVGAVRQGASETGGAGRRRMKESTEDDEDDGERRSRRLKKATGRALGLTRDGSRVRSTLWK